jgi:leucyl aminopeptidase
MENQYLPDIFVIEEDYEIPQLGRRRRISALLPHDYHAVDTHYPVLYLHDGQNLFNGQNYHQNWAIDESLAQLAQEGFKDLIIIAIDHGGEERVTEYSPYFNPRFGDGDGEKYMQFLMETLKPYVDNKFRVLPDRENTGIGGSSMGGLISLYAGMRYQEVFGKLMIFSPSLWISPKVFYDTSRFVATRQTDMYVYAGEKESRNHISNVNRLRNSLFRSGVDQSLLRYHTTINPEGSHNEGFWREEFPEAVKWLYFSEQSSSPNLKVEVQEEMTGEQELWVLPFFEGEVNVELIEEVSGIANFSEFKGKAHELTVLYHGNKSGKLCLLGLGQREEKASLPQIFRSFAFQQYEKWQSRLGVYLSHLAPEKAFAAVLGIRLAMYHPGMFKSESNAHPFQQGQLSLNLVHPDQQAARAQVKEALATVSTQIQMMQLVNLPANVKTPAYLSQYAQESGEKYGYSVKVLEENELMSLGLDAVLAVGQGSENSPVLIEMEYKPKGYHSDRPELALVGKGITFDTGGVSMKSPTNMHYMKSDMGGGVAVMGAIELAAKLQLPIHLVGVVPVAENSVDATSLKPGDVIDSYSRKTIEVIDTDAEGRLVLADGLAYVQEHYQPETVIDLATLTGSVVRALGYSAAGLFTSNDELAFALSRAGEEVKERVWRLPLYPEFERDLESDIADVKNFSGKPIAGAITAAKFLEFFIKDHPRWAHLDIAGVAFGDSEFTKMKSATGYGIRLLITYMKNKINAKSLVS